MTVQEQIRLIDVTRTLANGRETETETSRIVWAGVRSVTRTEYYQAYQAGVTASLTFKVNTDELGAAEYVEYPVRPTNEPPGDRYKILRSYRVDAHYTEITVERMR